MSDSALWSRALESGLQLPEGKKLLGDTGLGLSSKVLVPYRGVRYHLKEYATGTLRPRNAKARFKILIVGSYFDLHTQDDTFPALAVVHNIIRRTDPTNNVKPFHVAPHDPSDDFELLNVTMARSSIAEETRQASAYRDRIASRMWNSPSF
ncbi:hypothetical protein OC842_001900 [Tilletia horrida]|uniref:Uncharacterized protein n=1 Tax=Tilletia horrida TaxID=155126 RepID=A0AAN6JM49_9BASI|nr:hypothetical protein OC842_001900 [Tilletia horrida]